MKISDKQLKKSAKKQSQKKDIITGEGKHLHEVRNIFILCDG